MRWPAPFVPAVRPALPGSDCQLWPFAGEALIVEASGQPASAAALAALPAPDAALCIGEEGPRAHHALRWAEDIALPAALSLLNLRQAWGVLPEGHWAIAARAKQLLAWDRNTRFCGACGHATALDAKEPAKRCPHCGHLGFPQIAPAIMCLVRRGNALLLARSPHFRPNMYSALAGFVESGESVEACVEREVLEETGIRITNLRWFSSQAWPFPCSLMLAFHADHAGGEITPQPGEIEDAGWFTLDNLPELPAPVSIAARLIADGVAQLQHGV